ncbi:sugar/nucleoside kinase (ribokinase family) [Agromyces flavus]|uniref:Sugar or nucleoside kinase, ribokinase family n=1 Tax=Agromyces flavus TaxID=589382 RepID=A0A1H1ZZL3_9MICO|nr:PfkB family carbohydrate kinase [Agromyces flavus]MCP2367359.1 sugar/nucleoside kinase (ribokinase family) [Agromyces flavus]GGI45884.1 ribokinase [Agromyces flavus]SDT39188.1 Sugar or nucleoside kinase, ribokinase family [Agromyces flavus]
MRVLGFGDNIVDRFLDRGLDYPGGNCVNVAVFAHRLGAEAGYLGVFGDDAAGTLLQEAIAAEGVDLSRSVVRAGESGVSALRVDDGERTFLGWNGGGVTVRSPLVLDDALLEYAAGFDLVHSSVYSRSEAELPKLAASRELVSFDLSSEDEFRTPEYLDRVAPHADLVLLSCSHLDVDQTRALLAEAVSRGASVALATRGTDGAIVTDGAVTVSAPARLVADPSTIVDTMGCGDAFLAGFVVSLLGTGWRRDAPPSNEQFAVALRAGADAAYDQCFVEGAFARARPSGEPVALSEESAAASMASVQAHG